ncbi:stabilizer of axonemal microtubules 2 [Microcaecilia unicolor]|uniref:Stabilizer of axonemal microtubules 2 n=1 Tax=Microcaecilia unicolor TaxID=1415580 RepID=A0A6P7X6S0_9AMPH|nr:stabilizer of axonemal microtubules 2 [Microcaecilia unicolor]
MRTKCICEICTCGRHHCPHRTRIYGKEDQPCFLTEYVEKYPQYGSCIPPQSLKPKLAYQPDRGRMNEISTFRSDYIPYDVSPPFRMQQEYKPKTGQVDYGTTYKTHYNPHKVQPTILARPPHRKHSLSGKYDTLPTYRDDYRQWDSERREPIKQGQTYQPPTGKVMYSTTFQDEFIDRGLVPTISCKPSNAIKPCVIPFNGATSHRISYVPHVPQPRFVKPKEEYKPSSQPLEDITTHRLNFKGLLGELTKSCKPEQGKIGSDARFDGTSEFHDSFQPWSVSLPQFHKFPDYVAPSTPMDMDTTTHIDYIQKRLSPVGPFKPVSQRKKCNAPFQSSTTMKEDFRAWDSSRTGIIKRDEQMPKPDGKFSGLTTFQSHYVPHEITLTQSCKPPVMPLHTSVPFESGTMYRAEYTPKKPDICPASYPSPPGFEFERTDEHGHKHFREVTPQNDIFSVPNGNPLPKEVAVMS